MKPNKFLAKIFSLPAMAIVGAIWISGLSGWLRASGVGFPELAGLMIFICFLIAFLPISLEIVSMDFKGHGTSGKRKILGFPASLLLLLAIGSVISAVLLILTMREGILTSDKAKALLQAAAGSHLLAIAITALRWRFVLYYERWA